MRIWQICIENLHIVELTGAIAAKWLIDYLRAINCVIFTIEVFSRYGEEVVQSQGPCQLEDVVDDDHAMPCSVDPSQMIPVHIEHIGYTLDPLIMESNEKFS